MYSVMIYSYEKDVVEEIADELKNARQECMEIIKYDNPYLALLGSIYEEGYDIVIFHVVNHKELEFSRRMRFYHNDTIIIYLSNDPDMIPYLRKAEPFDCIVGEKEYMQFNSVLDDAFARVQTGETLFFEYSRGKQKRLADLNNIIYFYSDHRIVRMTDNLGEEDYFYAKLDEVEVEVHRITSMFKRVSKSYLINKTFIDRWEGDEIIMKDSTRIRVSRSHVKETK